ncbi:MAG: bifunctional riboflavin kinase/FAD synthetase, partial [Alphaproteobacteria bacterium]
VFQGLSQECRGSVIAIGNFDGVHRGHQALLAEAAAVAGRLGKKRGVLTFEPHPRHLFRPDEPPGRLTPPVIKHWRLDVNGVEVLYSLPFDWDFASQSAEDFIRHVLIEGLNAAHVVVGEDFRFGQLRKGEAKDIVAAGIPVSVVKAVADDSGEVYSSSLIRRALRQGDIDTANKMLGWEWEMRGVVVKGDQRGRELGFPTANFSLGDAIHPAYGVYAALVNIEGESDWRFAAVNIGIRPMFESREALAESYIFDFNREIYGTVLRVRPVARLRSEAKFLSVEALVRQMGVDCADIRSLLTRRA